MGIAKSNWNQRLHNHRQNFNDKKHKKDTTLSSYLWALKENHNQIPKLTWSIVRFAPGYSNISKRCLLCLHEKLLILTYCNPAELLAQCHHENKFLLSNYKDNVTKIIWESVYLRIAEGNWKQRLYNHTQYFKDQKHNKTVLSSYL